MKEDYQKIRPCYIINHHIITNRKWETDSHTVVQSRKVRVRVISYMSVCSQGAAAYPENEDQQQRLREAAEGLRVATNAAAQNAIKKKLVNRLEVSRRVVIRVSLDLDQNLCIFNSKTQSKHFSHPSIQTENAGEINGGFQHWNKRNA